MVNADFHQRGFAVTEWDYDVERAKTLGWVLVCMDDKHHWIGFTRWIESENRWMMIGTKEVPLAFCKIEHPLTDRPSIQPGGVNLVARPPAFALPPGVGEI